MKTAIIILGILVLLGVTYAYVNCQPGYTCKYNYPSCNSYCNGNVESYYSCDCIPDHPMNVCCKCMTTTTTRPPLVQVNITLCPGGNYISIPIEATQND